MKTGRSIAVNATYWTTTILFSLMMAASAFGYLTSEYMAHAFVHLGFPAYFRVELAVAKFLGVIALLAPVAPRLKEWAYAGFVITLVSAIIAHTSVDGPQMAAAPLTALAVLLTSYATRNVLVAARAARPAAPGPNNLAAAGVR